MKFSFFVIGMCWSIVYCSLNLRIDPPTTEPYVDIQGLVDKIEVPQDEINKAMEMDAGKYTTQTFHYQNNQFITENNETYNNYVSCIDEFMKCQLSQTMLVPICAFNGHRGREYGYYTMSSYCGIYFDNCRRGYRVWRILDQGQCRFWFNSGWDDVYHTFRRNTHFRIFEVLNNLAAASSNYEVSASKYASKFWMKPLTKRALEKMEEPIGDIARTEMPDPRKDGNPLVFDLLEILSTQPGNTEISVSKHSDPGFWSEQDESKRRDTEDFTNDIDESVLPYTRRNKQRIAVDLLKILAAQSGNTEISVSKL